MNYKLFKFKVKERLWREIVNATKNTVFYHFIFKSYWHYIFHKRQDYNPTPDLYYGARPNFFAGIGHQMANWIDGYYWATKRFNLRFAHFPFSTKRWDDFLGFGYNESQISDLRKQGYKLRRLPQFTDSNPQSVELVKNIIASYQGKKVIFWPPQDHFYKEQYGVMNEIQKKFREAPVRKNDSIQYDKDKFNIAIHVRRTVFIEGKKIEESDKVKALRWLSNDYYEKVLKQVLENINVSKPIAIWIFSTGKAEEFKEFSKYGEVHFCSDMDEYQSFAHLVFADLLITSKSSFSYKPALLNRGIKVCPRNFWHDYPDTKDWILAENDGTLDLNRIKEITI